MLVMILWIVIDVVAILPYIEKFKELDPGEQFGVGVIFLLCGPIFAINGIATFFLDLWAPGWDEEDNTKNS